MFYVNQRFFFSLKKKEKQRAEAELYISLHIFGR